MTTRKRPDYNRLMLLQMDDKAFRKNRAELRKYLERSASLHTEPATKRGRK